ncbi:MAG: hypothetical protein ACLVD8_26190 [Enterocloster sp.]|uniref:hypothetical protein n=1 Tax=Enterocloster sp. TaxID=2719315 RepID=UPI00399A66C7
MSLEALNSRISYVAQINTRSTLLLENIRIGRLDATDEEVLRRRERLSVWNFWRNCLKASIPWRVTRAKMLSGGQRQRISWPEPF